MKSEQTKETIILHTIQLIQEGDGCTDSITIRKIAAHCGLSIGLINHYFGSKEALIEACVQRLIYDVVHTFKPNDSDLAMPPALRTASVLCKVADFLMANQQISTISILGDLNHPKTDSNTMGTVMGITRQLSDGTISDLHKQQAFALVSVLQDAFLHRAVLKDTIALDFNDKQQRDRYLCEVVSRIVGPDHEA